MAPLPVARLPETPPGHRRAIAALWPCGAERGRRGWRGSAGAGRRWPHRERRGARPPALHLSWISPGRVHTSEPTRSTREDVENTPKAPPPRTAVVRNAQALRSAAPGCLARRGAPPEPRARPRPSKLPGRALARSRKRVSRARHREISPRAEAGGAAGGARTRPERAGPRPCRFGAAPSDASARTDGHHGRRRPTDQSEASDRVGPRPAPTAAAPRAPPAPPRPS